jgi:hypothetical protein
MRTLIRKVCLILAVLSVFVAVEMAMDATTQGSAMVAQK